MYNFKKNIRTSNHSQHHNEQKEGKKMKHVTSSITLALLGKTERKHGSRMEKGANFIFISNYSNRLYMSYLILKPCYIS